MSNIGPQLPAHLRKGNTDVQAVGPMLPTSVSNEIRDLDSDNTSYGPSLPPGFQDQNDKEKVMRPSLPTHITNEENIDEDEDEDDDSNVIGPILPSVQNDLTATERIQKEFEQRAESMKNKLTGKNDPNEKLERESWMTELPDALTKNFGLGPRSFRSKAVNLGDQSIWTDTPADKERKRQEARDNRNNPPVKKVKKEVEKVPTAEEKEMEERVTNYNNKTRPQSLLEMHKNKKDKSEDTGIRRPFNRDRDLAINRTDPKEKAKFISQAQSFNSKFSKGSYESKFL